MVLGIPVVLITAIAVYMVATVVATECLKKRLYVIDPKNHRHSLLLSWVTGFFFYLMMFFLEIQEVDFASLVLFIVITGFLSRENRFESLKRWIRKVTKS